MNAIQLSSPLTRASCAAGAGFACTVVCASLLWLFSSAAPQAAQAGPDSAAARATIQLAAAPANGAGTALTR
jgi:hypothetical protein